MMEIIKQIEAVGIGLHATTKSSMQKTIAATNK
jgi:hypothetical protein